MRLISRPLDIRHLDRQLLGTPQCAVEHIETVRIPYITTLAFERTPAAHAG